MASTLDDIHEANEPSHPVVIITDKLLSKRRKERDEKHARAVSDSKIFVSPLNSESVQGCPADKTPDRNGVSEIKKVTDCLRAAGTSCCLVGEAALIYYGARRVLHVHVPSAWRSRG